MWLLQHALLLALLFLCWYLAGRGLARALGVEHRFAPWVLGPAAQVTLSFALAAAGLLPSGWGAWVQLVLPALPGVPGFRVERPSRAALMAGCALAVSLAPLALLAATPAVSWDAEVYHLAIPRLYLEHGGFRPIEMNVYSNWPLGTELLFAQALAIGGATLAKLVHFGFGILVLFLLWTAGVGWGGRGAAALALLTWLVHPVVLFEHRVAYVELAHSFWLLAAFLLLEAARRDPQGSSRTMVVAGVAAGMLAGVKLTGGLHALLLAAVVLPGIVRKRGLGTLAAFFGPLAILGVPWSLKAWWFTENPIYPFGGSVFETPDWSARLAEQLAAWQSAIGPGRTPLDILLLPFRVFLSGGRGYEQFDGELAAVGLFVVPVGLFATRALAPAVRSPARRAMVLAGCLFLQWAVTSQQMRLLVPTLALVALPVALGWTQGVGSRTRHPRATAAGLAVLLSLALVAENRSALLAGWRSSVPLAAGVPEEIRASGVPLQWRELRQVLGPEDHLLMLQTNRRFFAPCEVLADSFFEASQVRDWLADAEDEDEILERWAERGISHVLLDRRPSPIEWPPSLLALLETPGRLALRWSSPDGRYLLWEVPAEVVG